MDYEKMSTFYTSSTKLTPTNCLATPPTPTLQSPLSPTRVPLTPTPSFKVAAAVSTNAFLDATTNATTTTAATAPAATTTTDPYSSYADNFDLSLLPQDCAASIENIPTIVYQYAENHATAATTPATPPTPTAAGPATPQIKIEQFWSNSPRAVDEIKQEPLGSTSHQLIPPPPPYPSNYPSPQSSPAQSEYCFPQTPYASCYDSISSSRSSLYPASPYPTLDASSIKQELHILPPSPPESNCEAPSPHSAWPDIKSEPIDADVEMLIDLNALLEKKDFSAKYNNANNNNNSNKPASSPMPAAQVPQQLQQQQLQQQQTQNHQLLREFLENNTFQLGCLDGMDEVNGNIEQVISKALEDTKSQAVEICAKLQISQDPSAWSTTQVHAWLRSTIAQFKLPQIEDLEMKFREDGAALILLTEEEFKRRAPESGSDLYAQLEVWRYHFNNTAVDSDDEDDMLPTTSGAVLPPNAIATATALRKPEGGAGEPKRTGRTGGSHIHLWQFLKELLAEPHCYGTAIRWIDRARGIFKIEDSVRVAKLWGNRKNRPAMNYDKLSRSIRQYYKKGIMKKTERSQRLVYQFCAPYQL